MPTARTTLEAEPPCAAPASPRESWPRSDWRERKPYLTPTTRTLRLLARLIKVSLGLAFLSLIGAFIVAQARAPRVEATARASLQKTADERAGGLLAWLGERRNISKVLGADPGITAALKSLLEAPYRADRRAAVATRLIDIQSLHGYRSVQVLDPQFRPIVSVGLLHPLLHGDPQRALSLRPLNSLSPTADLVILPAGPNAPVTLCWQVSIGVKPNGTGGWLLRCSKLEDVSFIPHWRTPSITSETSAHTLLLADGRPLLVAAATGTDWRHPSTFPVPPLDSPDVLSSAVALAGTDLTVAARVARREALWPMRKTVWGAGLAMCVLLLVIAGALARTYRSTHIRRLSQDLEHAEHAASCLQQFFELPFLGMGALDLLTLRWVKVNPLLCAMTGYTEDELVGMPFESLVGEHDSDALSVIRECEGACSISAKFIPKNGAAATLSVALDVHRMPAPPTASGQSGSAGRAVPACVLVTVQDLTERELSLARIRRLTKAQSALRLCNRTIAQSDTEEALFARLCQDVVEAGGMKMARVGILDEDTGRLKPVASFGAGKCYAHDAGGPINPKIAKSPGPSGMSAQEKRPVWCQDFLNDPLTLSWQARAKAHGWCASAALPLSRNGKVIGVLVLHANEASIFTPQVRQILQEMAEDLGYALDSLARISDREAALSALKASEEFTVGVLDSLPEQVVVVDALGHITAVNLSWRKFVAAMGHPDLAANSRGRSYLEIAALMPAPAEISEAREAVSGIRDVLAGRVLSLDMRFRSIPPEAERWFRMRVTPLNGHHAGAVIAYENITKHEAALAHIWQLAHFDALTGLPNRSLLTERVTHDLSRAKRGHEPLALLFLDLDRFKYINDSLGHGVGDNVLRQVADRLQSAVRAEDTVSRLGGDEFILVLPGTDVDGAAHAARNLMELLAKPCLVDQNELTVTSSMGIAMYPADGDNYAELSRCADIAMYRAKRAGRNTYQFFTAEMQARSVRTLQLENALRRALEQAQFKLCYQPQLAIGSGLVIGVEALLRWTHPELGEVSPAEFIPVAEDSGLILPIGEWTLREAARQMKAWDMAGVPPVTVAVNLSPVQFRQADLPELVTRILTEAGVPASRLELELTEGAAMTDPTRAIEMMDDLHQRGIRLAIDDFGTGYSSLSYLKRFHLSKLKIDQSFVNGITDDPEDRAIVRALLALSRSLELSTLAEGVSTKEQRDFLEEQGCDAVQGYYFSVPLTPDAFADFVRAAEVEKAAVSG